MLLIILVVYFVGVAVAVTANKIVNRNNTGEYTPLSPALFLQYREFQAVWPALLLITIIWTVVTVLNSIITGIEHLVDKALTGKKED